MKRLSTIGMFYMAFCAAACMWFSVAAVKGWHGIDIGDNADGSGSGRTYHSGSSYGRSSGGFWGGGK